jgi:hypothetical protein
MDLTRRLIARWTEHGIAIPSGASDAEIATFESQAKRILPDDLRCYFATVNGMGVRGTIDDDFFSFWQLADVESIAQFVPDRSSRIPTASDYFIIADHSISLPSFAIRLSNTTNEPSPVASVFTDRGALESEDVFESFSEFLRSYLNNPMDTVRLPRGA